MAYQKNESGTYEKKRSHRDDGDRRWKKDEKFEIIQEKAPQTVLAEPPAPKPVIYCKLGCGRRAEYRVSVLLYPAKPTAIGPTSSDRGARVVVGHACKHHRKSWSVATFLNSPESNKAKAMFLSDFGAAPYPPLCQLEIVRGLEVRGVD